jgi:L,D-transpeptidase ErfK/SrfK
MKIRAVYPMRRLPILATVAACLAMSPAQADNGVPDMIGVPTRHVVSGEETFVALMARYGVGYTELVAANRGADPWLPKPGSMLDIPTAHLLPQGPRQGIVVNLADQRLYWFADPPAAPQSFPIGIGREGWSTPLGETTVAGKRENPVWYPPASIRAEQPSLPGAVPPGPDNPLGAHALYLGWDAYVIHGTNRPGGIGRRVSHGCIRLAPDDIARLFAAVAPGTPVTIVDQPVKLGYRGDTLYLEVHPNQEQADELEQTGHFTPAPIAGVVAQINAVAGPERERIDWTAVERAIAERRGVPVRITTPAP